MKRILLIGVALLVLIIGGVYLAQRNATPLVDTADPDTSSPATGGTTVIPEEGEVKLALGETAAFRGIMVTPLAVVEDSRCPANVNCIQAGTVRIKVSISSGLGTSTNTIKLGEFVTTETQKVIFAEVTPQKTTAPVDPKEYRFTIRVEKRPSSETNPGVTGGCYIGGCSAQICSEEKDAVSTCEYNEKYACYKTAKCERQPSGQCGWTPSAALTQCLNNAS